MVVALSYGFAAVVLGVAPVCRVDSFAKLKDTAALEYIRAVSGTFQLPCSEQYGIRSVVLWLDQLCLLLASAKRTV